MGVVQVLSWPHRNSTNAIPPLSRLHYLHFILIIFSTVSLTILSTNRVFVLVCP